MLLALSGEMRPGRHQSLASGINHGAETLQCMGAQKIQVPGLRKNNFVHGFESVYSQNRITDIARYDLSVRHDKLHIALSHVNSHFRQTVFWNPSEFRAGVHDELFDERRLVR